MSIDIPENWEIVWLYYPPPTPFHSTQCRLHIRFNNRKVFPVGCTVHGADFLPPLFRSIKWKQRTKEDVERELVAGFKRWLGSE